MRNPYKLIFGSIVCAALIWGGIAINHKFDCDGLEEDYLNAFSSLNRVHALESLAGGNRKLVEAAALLKKTEDGQLEAATEAIFAQCGERATHSALRKAGEAVGF